MLNVIFNTGADEDTTSCTGGGGGSGGAIRKLGIGGTGRLKSTSSSEQDSRPGQRPLFYSKTPIPLPMSFNVHNG